MKTKNPVKSSQRQLADGSVGAKRNYSYDSISRNIKESSLKNTDVAKMILIDRDRLERENYELKEDIESLQLVQLENAELKEKLKISKAFELFSTGSVAIGSLMAGALLIDPIDWRMAGPGIFFVVIGVLMKAIKNQ